MTDAIPPRYDRLAPHGGCNWEGCKECFPNAPVRYIIHVTPIWYDNYGQTFEGAPQEWMSPSNPDGTLPDFGSITYPYKFKPPSPQMAYGNNGSRLGITFRVELRIKSDDALGPARVVE